MTKPPRTRPSTVAMATATAQKNKASAGRTGMSASSKRASSTGIKPRRVANSATAATALLTRGVSTSSLGPDGVSSAFAGMNRFNM